MRTRIRLLVFAFAPALALLVFTTPLVHVGRAQTVSDKSFRPDTPRALAARQPSTDAPARDGAYAPRHNAKAGAPLARARSTEEGARRRAPARPAPVPQTSDKTARTQAATGTRAQAATRTTAGAVAPGTPLSRVLHVSQLSLTSAAGTDEEFVDRDGDLVADDRTTFDSAGGSYDVAVGRSGARYEVFTAVDDRGTANTSDDVSTGVLVLALDSNAMTLLPRGDLVVADFQSDELRVIRDTDNDGVPDTLDPKPFYTFPFSANAEDAPLDVASNSRGVVFTLSEGNDTRMLAVYDTDGDGFADADETCVEGLSVDNNLVLHGLTVARDGTVYVIEDATGEHDKPADGGNGGRPRVDAFPDPALNGILRDGSVFVLADDELTQAYSGLSFGVETSLQPVGRLTMTNSAGLVGDAPSGGLATVNGASLTRGLSGATQVEAAARGVRVNIEGTPAPVLSFNDTSVNIFVPPSLGVGLGSVVVSVGGDVTAADDARIVSANPGLFTVAQTGAGEAVALLASGELYTRAPFPARTNNQPSEVLLLGTGWRNSLPVTVQFGGKAAKVSYAGASGGFNGLDQINVAVPDGVTGAAPVVITTAGGASSRGGVFVTVQ